MTRINVEAASCGILQPLKWRFFLFFFTEQSQDDRRGDQAVPMFYFEKL